jgi:hypothetical protein
VTLKYQWLRDGAAITGATGSTYKLVAADSGKKVSVRVTGSLTGYTTATATSAQATVSAGRLGVGNTIITGVPRVSSLLTVKPGSWSPAGVVFKYQWLRDGVAISGATGSVYTPVKADLGRKISVRVSGSLAGYTAASTTSPQTTIKVYLLTTMFGLSQDLTGDGLGDVLRVSADGLLRVSSGSQTVGFATGSSLAAPTKLANAQVMGPGDLTGDGKADVAVVTAAGDLFVFSGTTKGRVTARGVKRGSGLAGYDVLGAGDLNGDKLADLVCVNRSNGKLYFLRMTKSGAFAARVQVGQEPVGWKLFAGGDLNGDGRVDLLGVDPSSGKLYLYAGKGNGTFGQRVQVGVGWKGYTVAGGVDLDGDRKPDLVARDDATGEVYFYKGRGGGSFATRVKRDNGW